MSSTIENFISRTLVLKAPLDKVWKAIGTDEGFSGWFCCRVEGDWREGQAVILHWPSGSSNQILLTKIEPQTLFVYQWHPGDYSKLSDHPASELTAISISLREVADGTELALIESGFENVPDERRLRVLGLNMEGWDEELENVRKYVEA